MMQLFTVLNLITPLALVLAATENPLGSGYTDISQWLLIAYNISVLAYGFFQSLVSSFKSTNLFKTTTYAVGVFLVVCLVREIIYGDVTTDNLPVIRCFLMFAILTFSGPTKNGDAFVCIIFLFFTASDGLLSIFFCQEYTFNDIKSHKDKMYMYVCVPVSYRALFMIVLFFPTILKRIALNHVYKTDCEILHYLKIYSNVLNRTPIAKDADAVIEVIDLLEQSREENVFKDAAVADRIVKTVRKILFLATLMQLFCVMTKYYDQRRSENIGVNLTSGGSDSLVYFSMQPYINLGSVAKIVETCLNNIYKDTFQVVVQHFKVLWKILTYISIVTINAFVFLLVVQSLFTFIAEIAEQNVKHFQNIQVNLATTQRIAYGSFLNKSVIYERNIREDVVFHCSKNYLYKFQTNTHRARFLWTHNDRFFDSSTSDRINISVTYKELYAESELTVLLIDETDFGEYKCLLVEETDEYIPILYTYLGNGITGSMLFEIRVTYLHFQEASYELRRQILTKNEYEIDAGTFVVFEIFAYATLAEIDDVLFQYTVNGIDISEICPRDWMSCYPLAFIKKNFWNTDSTRFSWQLDFGGLFKLYVRFCACSKIFGVHKLVIFRDYFNKTSRRTETIEIDHPVAFYFLPRGNDTGISKELFINNTKEFVNQYLENNDHIAIPISSNTKLRISVYSFFNFLSVISCLVFLYVFTKTIEGIMFFYCKLTIIPVSNFLLFGTIRPVFPSIERRTLAGITYWKEKLYDVFISYSDDDYQFAQNVILPYIERGCCKEACFPHRDLAHETGTKFHVYSKATQQSGKFIVILSRSYIYDPDCNCLQLLACIHPLLTGRSGEEKDLLIIKIEKDLEVPVQIRLDSRIQVIDWTITNDKHDNLRKIKEWLVGYS